MGDVIGARDGESGISRRELVVARGSRRRRAAARRARRGGARLGPGAQRGGRMQIKIGFVSPLTGPAAGFGEPDPYVIGLARKAFAKGLTIGGKKYDVKIIDKDSQSDPAQSRAGRERPDQQRRTST